MSVNVAFESFGKLCQTAYLGSVTAGIVKATLCMSQFDGAVDDEFVGSINDMDEMDGGYDPGFTGSDRATLSAGTELAGGGGVVEFLSGAASTTWTSLAQGTREVEGVLVYDHLTNDGGSTNIAFCDFGATVDANGQDFIVNWNSGTDQNISEWTFVAA